MCGELKRSILPDVNALGRVVKCLKCTRPVYHDLFTRKEGYLLGRVTLLGGSKYSPSLNVKGFP